MSSICQLIISRQRSLLWRFEGIQRVCQEDGGTIAEDVQLGAIVDELDFLTSLGHAYVEHLESMREAVNE